MEEAFIESLKYALDGRIYIETDMRAQFNPSRMKVIGELAEKLAQRLSTHCPTCDTPGWGKVRVVTGLPCSWCGSETERTKHEVFGCVNCSYQETIEPPNGLKQAEPVHCQYCNP